jgi:tetratricopeptide (TPR) repeat protein
VAGPSSFPHPRQTRDPARLFQEAIALHQSNRLEEAERLYQAVLRQAPRHTDTIYNLGLIRLRQQNLEEAGKLVRKALYDKPNSAQFNHTYGTILRDLGTPDAAMVYFTKALACDPNHLEARVNLAALLQSLNRYDEALQHFEKAVALQPQSARAHSNLGMILRTLGRLEEAHRSLEKAIELAPQTPSYYRILATSKRFVPGDRHLAAMEAMLDGVAARPEQEQIDLHFALGKAYADLGDRERSFRQLLDGNRVKRQTIDYDEAAVLAELEQFKALFSRDVIRERTGLGEPTDVPIFVVGMPRSGSTLIEQILASHPDVYGAGELSDFTAAVNDLNRGGDTPGDIGGEELRLIGARYLARLRARVPQGARRITDKMLGNLRFVGLIHLALPNARIIYSRRDALDNCLSCFSTLFGVGQHYSYDLGELGRFWRAHESLMRHWREVLPPGVLLEVQYEEVVADLETQARRIIAHCGLEWTDACLEFHKTERPVYTASVVQVRQPIYGSSVGRWKPYQALLQPLFDALELSEPS